MKKFAILYDQGIWNHAIVGFDDGSIKIIKEFNNKTEEWKKQKVDTSIKVFRVEKIEGKDFDIGFYNSKKMSRMPDPDFLEIRAFRENSTSFDIKFLGDYIKKDRTWIIFDEKPDIQLSVFEP